MAQKGFIILFYQHMYRAILVLDHYAYKQIWGHEKGYADPNTINFNHCLA